MQLMFLTLCLIVSKIHRVALFLSTFDLALASSKDLHGAVPL
jgi:hypothetical protein